MTDSSCPCFSGESLDACCGPLHEGGAAKTAEALMRSRYAAFARGEIAYLHDTHHPRTRESLDMESTKDWAQSSQWTGLEIVATEAGGPEDSKGIVEFVAHFSQAGQAQKHHERSRFEKEEGRWFYVDAAPIQASSAKVGRNSPCPCGSGKKYKKCCGRP